MKHFITILALSLGTFYSGAQITLTESNTPRDPGITESIRISSGITIPSAGANQLFDYTGLGPTSSSETYEYFAPTRNGFTQFTRFRSRPTFLANIAINVEYYSDLNANGYFEVGTHIPYQANNLMLLTGGATDSLIFPEQNNFFNNPDQFIPFPFTYGDADSTAGTISSFFELTVGVFNLSQSAGEKRTHLTRSNEAIGYGNIVLPMSGGQSIPYEVIMIKNELKVVDSIFLDGMPAPTPVMDAFGLVQGDLGFNNSYRFYAEGFEHAIFVIFMDETWTTATSAIYSPESLTLDNSVGLSTNSFLEGMMVYPNPAIDQIMVSNTSNIQKIVVHDLTGKIVKNIQSNNANSSTKSMEIDVSDLKNGAYFLKISSEHGTSTKKILINR